MKELTKEQEATLLQSIEVYGKKYQYGKVIEELSELVIEVANCIQGKFDYDKMVDEIADVEIVLKHLKNMKQINDIHVQVRKDFKIERLQKRINKLMLT